MGKFLELSEFRTSVLGHESGGVGKALTIKEGDGNY